MELVFLNLTGKVALIGTLGAQKADGATLVLSFLRACRRWSTKDSIPLLPFGSSAQTVGDFADP